MLRPFALPRHIIRAPNHLGDLVMALPALAASRGIDILVSRQLVPVLELAGTHGEVVPFDRGSAGFLRAVREMRRRGYGKGTLLTPSWSSALLFRSAGIPIRRGTATDRRSFLLSDPVPLQRFTGQHRITAYFVLTTGGIPTQTPAPRLEITAPLVDRWRTLTGIAPGAVGLFPGSHAAARRWAPERFKELARRLVEKGHRVVVLGGPDERALTAQVAEGGGFDAGGQTDIPLLAAALADCKLLVGNDSGPLHLAAAVGTPTVSLWGAGDPQITGPVGKQHRVIRHPELPCVPCVKNVCPRKGPGTVLPEAERECLAMILVDEVERAVEEAIGPRP